MLYKIFLIILSLSFKIVSMNDCYGDETNLYDFKWLDPDKEVFVLQKKVFKKKNTFFLNFGYLIGNTTSFQDTNGGFVRAGYYFHENHYIEGFVNTYSNKDNDSINNIRRLNASTPFLRKFNDFKGVNYGWSPFYGKINTFNKIFYFDVDFKLGIGHINAESNAETVSNSTTSENFKKESFLGINTAAQIKFYINRRININLEINRANYKADGPSFNGQKGSSKLRSNTDLMFSIGISF